MEMALEMKTYTLQPARSASRGGRELGSNMRGGVCLRVRNREITFFTHGMDLGIRVLASSGVEQFTRCCNGFSFGFSLTDAQNNIMHFLGASVKSNGALDVDTRCMLQIRDKSVLESYTHI